MARPRMPVRFASPDMENITLIGTLAFYGMALFLFVFFGLRRYLERSKETGLPPLLHIGKVEVWPYRIADLFAVGGIAGFFLLMVVSNAMVTGDETGEVRDSGNLAVGLVFNIGLQLFLAGLSLAMVSGRIGPVRWLGLAWKQWPWVLLLAPAAVVTMWSLFAGLQAVGYMELLESLGLEAVQDTVKIIQEEKDVLVLVLMGFTAIIIAPLCEEIVFRGYLYPVAKKFSGPWLAGICSALVFSAAHGNFAALLPLFAFGLVLAFLYEITGSIWAPMLAHLLFNGATFLVQMLIRFGFVPDVPA